MPLDFLLLLAVNYNLCEELFKIGKALCNKDLGLQLKEQWPDFPFTISGGGGGVWVARLICCMKSGGIQRAGFVALCSRLNSAVSIYITSA